MTPIGWEVDRFLRATTSSLPSVVAVGQTTLFKRIVDVSTASAKGLQKAVVAYPLG